MPFNTHLTLKSSNKKTGPIPVSTSSAQTCPPSCPLKQAGCYGNSGPLSLHWHAVTQGQRGAYWGEFCEMIAALPEGQLWRHNQCGDLPGHDGLIDRKMLDQLVEANSGRRGFSYSHYDPSLGDNADAIRSANKGGFVISVSANDLDHADRLADMNVGPVTTLVPEDASFNPQTPSGRKVVVCPAQLRDGVTCASCGLCAVPDRKVIIGFVPHGSQRREAGQVAAGNQ